MSTNQLSTAHAVLELSPQLSRAISRRLYPGGSATSRRAVDDDNSDHLAYLAEAIRTGDNALFVNYAQWLKVRYATKPQTGQSVESVLEALRYAITECAPGATTSAVVPILDTALAALPGSPDTAPSYLDRDAPYAATARQYLDRLLAADRRKASELVLQSAGDGAPIRDIYVHVFQPCLREVGRLWQMNRISVAQEHYCTAATQLVMAQLCPYVFSGVTSDRRMVATCVGGELHELGIRMVTDLMEMAGWDTYYLGANMTTGGILAAIEEYDAHLLALSATMVYHVHLVEETIAAVRASERTSGVSVMVGGFPFLVSPDLWRTVGADGFAPDPDTAIAVADRLVPGEKP
jgi:methanogenic corrinoid protein MtbC1